MPKSGIETKERNDLLHPGDDLYLHMNGRWLESSDIPEDKARYGAFTVLAEQAEKAVRAIIEESQAEAPGSSARKVGDLFTSFMDEDRIEAVGVQPPHRAAGRNCSRGSVGSGCPRHTSGRS